jgi:colicin import membrane protein
MKKPIIRSAARPASGFAVEQKLSKPMTFSFVGHLIFCVLFILLPKFSINDNRPAHYVNVQLVTISEPLPTPSPAAAPEAAMPEAAPASSSPSPAAETAQASTSSAAKTSNDAVSLSSSEPEKKQSMKKKTYKQERVKTLQMDSAIKNVEKEVTATQTDQKQQALDRIRNAVKEQEAQAAAESAGATGETAGISENGQAISDIQRIYQAEVAFHITKNWAFSEQLAGGEKNLYNEVVIKISRSGNIEDIWFDRRSDNSYFDDSTKKAILKSSPLPEVPDEISAPYTLGFRFNPDGLK